MGRVSKCPLQFRQQAATLVVEGGRGVTKVARELEVDHETLRNWVAAARKERLAGRSALSGEERLDLMRLRRKVAELESEKEKKGKDIPREAAVLFAKVTDR